MTNTSTTQPKKSIWKNKWLWIAIVGVLVIGGIVNAVNGGGSSKTDATTAAVPPADAAEMIEVPDVAGMTASEARDAIEAAGFRSSFDGGDQAVVMASNWDAASTTPAGGSKAERGSAVTLHVVKADERLQAEKDARDAKLAEQNAAYAATPLEAVEAQVFCSNYADQQFPFGVKLHTVLGKLAEEQTDAGWYMKFEATVTNEFNAKQEMNVECHMSGTNGAPVMDDFVAY